MTPQLVLEAGTPAGDDVAIGDDDAAAWDAIGVVDDDGEPVDSGVGEGEAKNDAVVVTVADGVADGDVEANGVAWK